MRPLWMGLLCAASGVGLFHPQPDPFAALEARYGLTLGVAARNLSTDQTLYYKADTLFPTASVIKLPVLVELYRQYARGYLHPRDTVLLDSSRLYPGSGVLRYLSVPRMLSLEDAAVLMIILSDNTATNLVFDKLGPHHEARLDSVNRTLRALGLEKTTMHNKPFSVRTRKNTPQALRYGIGMSTPREMLLLLSKLARGEVISPEASRAMIEILLRQQWTELAPRYLPVEADSLKIAHKTGAISTARSDVGIIFTPRDTIVYAVMTDHVSDPRWTIDNKGNLAVSEAARIVYERLRSR
ncbi:MAG: class A beta-lactamase-related serine hydrolase [Bacteroidetes bacterium]|nr:class A beta-lactamase-related serine hydrolase [Rhodothermia bacterium]MCX7907731.1 class A beta-lactamase-related serine hydrolase [Bacteroidota bacterium]MDW8286289.1 serine hydrolase [Bacteroidota bacterium]